MKCNRCNSEEIVKIKKKTFCADCGQKVNLEKPKKISRKTHQIPIKVINK